MKLKLSLTFLVVFVLTFFLTTCGGLGKTVLIPGPNGHNSLVLTLSNSSCPAGGITVLSGLDLNDDGKLGSDEVTSTQIVCNGTAGNNGHDSLVSLLDSSNGGGSSCESGGITLLLGVDRNDNQVLDSSEVTMSSDLCNGSDYPVSDFHPITLIDPCGDAPGIVDEVLVRISDGTLLASFSDKANGQNTRFSVLTEGTYETTDGSNCRFSVDGFGNIYGESPRH